MYNLACGLISSPLFKSDEEQLISQTTSQYPLKHTETTQEEIAAPGKLPETPLRMDPDLLYDVRYDDEFDVREPSQTDQIQMETPPKELISSYSVSQVMLDLADDMQYTVGGFVMLEEDFWIAKKSGCLWSLEINRKWIVS